MPVDGHGDVVTAAPVERVVHQPAGDAPAARAGAGPLEELGDRACFGEIVPETVAAEYDHIVPTAASRDLIGLVGSKDKQEIIIKGGHVSLVAGGNAVYRLWPQLDRWLSTRSV